MTVSPHEPGRREPGGRERCVTGHAAPVLPGLAAADRDGGHVSGEAEVACADRPAARDHRRHAALDHGEEEIEERRRDARTATREPDAAHDEGGATDGLGQRLADADGAATHQLLLEVVDLLAFDAKPEVGAETRVEAVDRLVACCVALHDRMRLGDGAARGVGQDKPAPAPGPGRPRRPP